MKLVLNTTPFNTVKTIATKMIYYSAIVSECSNFKFIFLSLLTIHLHWSKIFWVHLTMRNIVSVIGYECVLPFSPKLCASNRRNVLDEVFNSIILFDEGVNLTLNSVHNSDYSFLVSWSLTSKESNYIRFGGKMKRDDGASCMRIQN